MSDREIIFRKKRKIRVMASVIVPFVMAPLTIACGIWFMGDRKYVLISWLLLIYAMALFTLHFEGRRPQARELIVIAVLSAITVAGRAVFFMLPNFKPVAALVIISGVAFGSEAGFLVGCTSMLVSGFFFGQGPWTPWQMLVFGLIGFFAGWLFQKGIIKITKLSLCIYGFLSVIIIFGGIMNPASVIMYTGKVTWQGMLAVYISGFPLDIVHAISTVIFLWIGANPMIEKMERIKNKYGIM